MERRMAPSSCSHRNQCLYHRIVGDDQLERSMNSGERRNY